MPALTKEYLTGLLSSHEQVRDSHLAQANAAAGAALVIKDLLKALTTDTTPAVDLPTQVVTPPPTTSP